MRSQEAQAHMSRAVCAESKGEPELARTRYESSAVSGQSLLGAWLISSLTKLCSPHLPAGTAQGYDPVDL